METENWSVRVLVDAKTEYTKQLLDLLTPRFYEGILSLYDDSKGLCHKKRDNNILITFQQLLRSIPKWNKNILENEYTRIVNKSNCDFLEDLITAIFVANTKILSAIKTDVTRNKKHKLNLSIPNGISFIHKCYIQVAREFWKNPYLLDDSIGSCDIQRNMRDSYQLIDNAICESIRKQLPVRHILKEYLGEITEDDREDDDISSIMTNSERDNLKRLVAADIQANNFHQTKSKNSIIDNEEGQNLLENYQYEDRDRTYHSGNINNGISNDELAERINDSLDFQNNEINDSKDNGDNGDNGDNRDNGDDEYNIDNKDNSDNDGNTNNEDNIDTEENRENDVNKGNDDKKIVPNNEESINYNINQTNITNINNLDNKDDNAITKSIDIEGINKINKSVEEIIKNISVDASPIDLGHDSQEDLSILSDNEEVNKLDKEGIGENGENGEVDENQENLENNIIDNVIDNVIEQTEFKDEVSKIKTNVKIGDHNVINTDINKKEIKQTSVNPEIRSVMLKDISSQNKGGGGNVTFSINKVDKSVDNDLDSSSFDFDEAAKITELLSRESSNDNIKTVNLQLITEAKKRPVKKPRNLEYAFYD